MFIINDIGGYIKKSTFAIAFAKAHACASVLFLQLCVWMYITNSNQNKQVEKNTHIAVII